MPLHHAKGLKTVILSQIGALDGTGLPSIDPETGTYLSEDFTFCRRWSAIGGEVWLDASISLTHAGRASFRGDPSRRIGLAHHKAG